MEEKVLTTYVRGIYCRQCPEWIVDDLLHTRGVLADCGYPACEKGAPGSNPLRNALKSALGRRPEG